MPATKAKRQVGYVHLLTVYGAPPAEVVQQIDLLALKRLSLLIIAPPSPLPAFAIPCFPLISGQLRLPETLDENLEQLTAT
jgi:hypothetical protein